MPCRLEPLDLGIQIPYHFRCPISLELMTDPVTISTGQTYDRASIESWTATGNTTCPVTRSPLTDFALIPNHTLRRLIQEWCVANRSLGVERIPTPRQPADPATVRTLLSQASSESIRMLVRVDSLKRLRGLARDLEKNRAVISAQNAREILLSIVFSDNAGMGDLLKNPWSLSDENGQYYMRQEQVVTDTESDSCELTHESLAILSYFPLSESACLFVASNPERVSYLVNLLFHPSSEVRVNSASLIETVIAGTSSPELRSEISSSDEIHDGIVGILNSPVPSPRALKIGVKALFALCLSKQHRHKAVAAGAVEALIERLSDFDISNAERSLATVELLCRVPSGLSAFAAHALTVPLLVKVVLRVSGRATEYAAGALLSVCSASEVCRREAVAEGVLTRLLLVVQSGCTERAKRKAQMLLKLLRDSWPEDSGSYCEDFGCSDVVPY
ncbi:hypothetical protein RHMOL_Rhmol05G0105600 [Rhododendron molle]|uniref:Uncharacterized protein n=1 Tax=Rhododendron molle TaxID=49168 RepID=A0ACC0NMQ1_RHOML|nr:hypothetical protein RHMOL_Rhmol05G0105600 [Rhododendron molle]